MQVFSDWLKLREAFGPYIGPCVDTPNYQVWGACSDQNSDKKNKKIRQGNVGHKKSKSLRNIEEQQFQGSQPIKAASLNPAIPDASSKSPKWSASKDEILSYWKTLQADKPILVKPINYEHRGSTYGEDGIRITGSPQFISTVISHLKDFMAYETPQTKLAVSYRETESPSKMAAGQNKTSFVFYIAVKERGTSNK